MKHFIDDFIKLVYLFNDLLKPDLLLFPGNPVAVGDQGFAGRKDGGEWCTELM